MGDAMADALGEEKKQYADRLLDVNEVAELLRLAPGSVYHKVSRKEIPCVRLSARCLRFRRSDIDAWVAAKVDAPHAPDRAREGQTTDRIRRRDV
jgi:excisionase family DNA binding protein